MLERKIALLKQQLINYATFVENMIEKGIKGLMEKERDLLIEVIEKDEPKSNNLEIELDSLCTNLIAQYQPRAVDLRTVLMCLKMNNDLERIGDMAVNICESGLFLIERPAVKSLIDIPIMVNEAVKGMLKDSIDAFIKEDVKLARKVCERDNVVDKLKYQIVSELIAFMTSDTSTIERSLHLIRIAQNLERVADLSTNICEDVIYMAEGRIIKHHKND